MCSGASLVSRQSHCHLVTRIFLGYGLETGTAAELRLALTMTLTLTDTGFAVLTVLLGYTRRSPDPIARTQEALAAGVIMQFSVPDPYRCSRRRRSGFTSAGRCLYARI